jgi:hypothetical protein
VGGVPGLGYDVVPGGGRRMVNVKESHRVRDIFALFAEHPSLAAVVAELVRRRWKTKSWTSRNGTTHAGRDFAKASLRRLLTNAIHAGKVEHRGTIYPGEQASIVEPSVWEAVNNELRSGRRIRTEAIRVPQNALLTGLLNCKSCQRPTIPTYTAKPGRRYRYYVCKSARQNGWSSCPTKAVPARMIEDSVLDRLRTTLGDSSIREELNVPETLWQSFEQEPGPLLRALVKDVSYDGTTGTVSLNLALGRGANRRRTVRQVRNPSLAQDREQVLGFWSTPSWPRRSALGDVRP